MKTISNLLLTTLAFTTLLSSAVKTKAQGTMILTLSATAETQAGTNDNRSTRVIPEPTKLSLDTKSLLTCLAVSENAETNYADMRFPPGAKLVLTGTNSTSIQVWDANNNLLVDVSDIVSLSLGTNVVLAGKISDTTGLAAPTVTRSQVVALRYDDTFIKKGSALSFVLQGVAVTKVTDTTPDKAGIYSQTQSSEMARAAGDGSYLGAPLVVSGSLKISGGATLKKH